MPMTYAELRDLHDSLGLSDDLPAWAAKMNQLTGTQNYSAGMNDSWLRRRSQDLDSILEYSGLPSILGAVGRGAGSLVGEGDTGESIGHGALRTALDFAPMSLGAPGIAASALLSGIRSYADTGSTASGLVSGLTTAVLPGAADLAGQGFLKGMGAPLLKGTISTGVDDAGNVLAGQGMKQFSRRLPENLTQGIGAFAAQTLAAGGVGEISNAVDAAFDPNRDYEFNPAKAFLGATLGQLPFAAHLLSKSGMAQFGGKATRDLQAALEANIEATKPFVAKKQAELDADKTQPIENVPIIQQPTEINLTQQALADENSKKILARVMANNVTPTPEGVKANEKLNSDYEDLRARHGDLLDTKPLELPKIQPPEINPEDYQKTAVPLITKLQLAEQKVQEAKATGDVDLQAAAEQERVVAENELSDKAGGLDQGALANANAKVAAGTHEWVPGRGLQKKDIFGPAQRALAAAHAAVDSAKTLSDFHLAAAKLNEVRAQQGLPLVTQERLNTIAQNKKLSPSAALKTEINKTQRLADVLAEPKQTEQETQRIKDQENQLRAQVSAGKEVSSTAGENRGTQGGVPVVSLPKLSSVTQPIHDMADEAIHSVAAHTAIEEYARYQKDKGTSEPVGAEAERYKIYLQMLRDKDISGTSELSHDDTEAFSDALGAEGLRPKSPEEVMDFPSRPHIQIWNQAFAQKMAEKAGQVGGQVKLTNGEIVKALPFVGEGAEQTSSPAPIAPTKPIPAGAGFVWGLEDYDPESNRIGKHTLPKTGILKVSQFKNMGGRGKPLSDAEIKLQKLFVPEAFDKDGNVDVRKLYEGLKTKGPVVEVKKWGNESSPEAVEFSKLVHEHMDNFDTAQHVALSKYYRGEIGGEELPKYFNSEDINAVKRLKELQQYDLSNGGNARYSFLGPKPESDMPGYVEGLVRVPQEKYNPESSTYPAPPKYRGPHFGNEDNDVLAFFRGYEETLPSGEKAFHVIEVQSDWGHKVHADKDKFFEELKQQGHPLLDLYEPLALKAAIAHAKSIGATKIILSDAETAMMTEGHDKQGTRYRLNKEGGEPTMWTSDKSRVQQALESGYYKGYSIEEDNTPSQSAGMRLHYDTTLPSAMAKLTGDKGERVELGPHDKGFISGQINDENGVTFTNGSPVFRDPSGNPKTQISGRIYDLSKIANVAEQQGGLTLTNPSSAPKPEPYIPADSDTAATIQKMDLGRGGAGLADFVSGNTSDPEYKAVIDMLRSKFPEQLARTGVTIKDPFSSPSTAYLHPHTREGNIALDASLLYAPADVLNRVAIHELVHQVTQGEIDNPTNLDTKNELDAVRERLVSLLPKDLKAAYDKAIDSDWLSGWRDGSKPFSELHPDVKSGQLLYGLLNVKEMLAEGLTPKSALQKFMLSQKSEQKQGLWSKFKDLVARLIGFSKNPAGTAFGDFLKHAEALSTQGEHIASFYNYGERFFEGQGNNRALAQSQTLRAAGLLHLANEGSVAPEDIVHFLSNGVYSTVSGEELAKFRPTPGEVRTKLNLDRSLQNGDEDAQHLVLSGKDLGIEPTRQGLNGFLQEAITGASSLRDALVTLPETAARYIFERAKSMKSVLESLQGASDGQNEGFLNITDPQSVREPVSKTLKAINRVLAYEQDFDNGADIINGLSATTPQGFLAKSLAAAPKWSDASPAPPPLISFLDPAEPQPKKKGVSQRMGDFFKRNFLLMNQYTDQVSQELFTKMRQLGANIHKFSTDALKMWAGDFNSGDNSLDAKKGIMQALADVGNRKASESWIYQNQIANRDAVTMLEKDNPAIKPILAGKTPKQVQQIEDFVRRHGLANFIAQRNVLKAMTDVAQLNGTGLLNAMNGGKQQQNATISRTMWEILSVNKNDPVAVAKMQSDLMAIRQRMTDEQFNALFGYMDKEQQAHGQWQQYFDANPNWASAKRVGEYILTYRDKDGKVNDIGVDSQKDANQVLAENGGKLLKMVPTAKPGDEEIPEVGTDWQGISDKLQDLQDAQIDILKNASGFSAEDLESIKKTSPINMFSKQVNATGVPDFNAPARQLNRGAEKLPYISNQINWINQQARYWNRRKLKAQFDSYLRQSELTPDMKAQVTTMRDNFLRPNPSSVRTFNNFVRTWYIGAQVAMPMMNLLQAFQTHVTELTNMGTGILGGYKRVMGTIGQLMSRYVSGKDSWGDPEYQRLEKDAKAMGELGGSKYDDDAALREASATNLMRAAQSGKPKTVGQIAGSLWGSLSRGSMALFQTTESFNNHLGILTAFKLFREQGQSYEQARDNAFSYNSRVNFTGAKAARPLGLGFQSTSPTIRGVAMLATAMKSYMLGSLAQTVRFINRGFFDNSSLTPAERFNAKKAAFQSLGTQFAAAGLLGLPFVSAMLALIEKTTGVEVNKKLRETVHSIFNEDDDNGGALSDATMTGLPSMLGWDLQSRLSQGNSLPGVSEFDGFQPENLLGPSVNMLSDFVKGAKGVAGGTPAATSLVPPALRKLQQLVTNDGTIRDYRDRPVLNDLSPGEKLGVTLGFNPKRLSDFNSASRMADLTEQNTRTERNQENQQMAEEAMRGNFGSVRQSLLQKAQQDKSFDPTAAVEDISRVAEELTFPRDLRREGAAPERSKILSYFNVNPTVQPTEVQRLQFRLKLQQSLGLPTPPSSHDVLLAQTIDALRAKSPGATRVDLRQAAELLLRKSSRENILAQ